MSFASRPSRFIRRLDRWQPTSPRTLRRAPPEVRAWLAWPHSLTDRVARHVGAPVKIHVLSEQRARLLPDERERLNATEREGRVREVHLIVEGRAYVAARTVFRDVRSVSRELTSLGNRSLGSLLFGPKPAPVVRREFICIQPQSQLWATLRSHLPDDVPTLWARRALHLLHGQPLLVTEVFLPTLFRSNR